MDLPIGYLLQNRYRVEAVLGQGGFGITYRAYDLNMRRQIAIKELFISGSSTRSGDQSVRSVALDGIPFVDFKAKFLGEAQELAGIQHHNIVNVYDHFEANNTAYYSMAYVEGMTLQALVAHNGPLSAQDAVNVIDQLMNAVEELHRRNKLHRDLKPANVMISSQWKVVLIDFGTTRDFGDGRTVSTVAMVAQGYSPLEQYGEQSLLDERSDLYALGATLYFLLTSVRPLPSPNRDNNALLPPPRELNPQIDEKTSNSVMRALAMRPADRFQSVVDFRHALTNFPGPPPPLPPPPPPPSLNILIAIFTILTLAMGFWLFWFNTSASMPIPIRQLIDNMVPVKGGKFTMGCTHEQGGDCYGNEKPPHLVTVVDFYIGRYEVTQLQWRTVMGSDPSELYNKGCDQCPVERVSWDDLREFINKLNDLTEYDFRLPTEAEWEYAARGGNKSRSYKYSGSNNINEMAWYEGNAKQGNTHGAKKTTRPVGGKNSNELGLYDMSGNVRELCSDWYKGYPGSSGITDETGSFRVFRGGGWSSSPRDCRVSYRSFNSPTKRRNYLGFRLARSN